MCVLTHVPSLHGPGETAPPRNPRSTGPGAARSSAQRSEDPELPATLRALLAQAAVPERLRVGLVWQGDGEAALVPVGPVLAGRGSRR